MAIRNLPSLTVLLTLSSAVLALLDHKAPWLMPCATALAAAFLLLLHNRWHSIAPITLRAAADLALTTPILLVPFLNR